MVNKDMIKKVGTGSLIIGSLIGVVYLLKKKGVFNSDVRRWSYENPIQNESQEWKYFQRLNRGGVSNYKRSIDINHMVRL